MTGSRVRQKGALFVVFLSKVHSNLKMQVARRKT
jgi:hypothetical protein